MVNETRPVTFTLAVEVTVPAGTEVWEVITQVEKMIENNSDDWSATAEECT